MKAIEELEADLAAATPGEWYYDKDGFVYGNFESADGGYIVSDPHSSMLATDDECAANGRLIARAKNALPALIECAKALVACRCWLREYNVQMGPDTGLHMLQEDAETALAKLEKANVQT